MEEEGYVVGGGGKVGGGGVVRGRGVVRGGGVVGGGRVDGGGGVENLQNSKIFHCWENTFLQSVNGELSLGSANIDSAVFVFQGENMKLNKQFLMSCTSLWINT